MSCAHSGNTNPQGRAAQQLHALQGHDGSSGHNACSMATRASASESPLLVASIGQHTETHTGTVIKLMNPKGSDCFLQDISSAYPALLRAVTAACQNDYNCKAAAKQGAAGLAASLLSSSSSDTVFEAVCLLYTLTTQAEARLAVGKALVKTSGPQDASAVGQLFVLLASPNPGQYVCLQRA